MGEKNLKENLDFVKENRDKLLGHYRNKFILVFEKEIIGSFDTYDTAAEEGFRLYGLDKKFLVYHLIETEPVNFIMHAV